MVEDLHLTIYINIYINIHSSYFYFSYFHFLFIIFFFILCSLTIYQNIERNKQGEERVLSPHILSLIVGERHNP